MVRYTSGELPPRSQVIVEPLNVRFWVTGPMLVSSPILVQGCPASSVKKPPTRRSPPGCNARDITASFAVGVNVLSMVAVRIETCDSFARLSADLCKQPCYAGSCPQPEFPWRQHLRRCCHVESFIQAAVRIQPANLLLRQSCPIPDDNDSAICLQSKVLSQTRHQQAQKSYPGIHLH